jgi:hypothetical protein
MVVKQIISFCCIPYRCVNENTKAVLVKSGLPQRDKFVEVVFVKGEKIIHFF